MGTISLSNHPLTLETWFNEKQSMTPDSMIISKAQKAVLEMYAGYSGNPLSSTFP
jgi:hypothetical protein